MRTGRTIILIGCPMSRATSARFLEFKKGLPLPSVLSFTHVLHNILRPLMFNTQVYGLMCRTLFTCYFHCF